MNTNFQVRTRLQECQCGKSLVAVDDIKCGQLIWHNETKIVDTAQITIHELMKFSPNAKTHFIRYCWQDANGLYTGCIGNAMSDMTNYINHSCDPNMWFDGDDRLVAQRDIRAGEQLTIDYGTCDSTFCVIESCLCGSDRCRGIITPMDYMILDARYANHMRSYLLSKYAKHTSAPDFEVSKLKIQAIK